MPVLRIARTTFSDRTRQLPSLNGCRPTSEDCCLQRGTAFRENYRVPTSNATWANNRRGPLRDVCLLRMACARRCPRTIRKSQSKGRSRAKRSGQSATKLSGIACQPPVRGERTCLVVNDESPFAQLATVRERRLIAGRTVDLIAGRAARLADNVPLDGVFGSEAAGRPTLADRCPDRSIAKDFDEFDGEGVAWSSTASGGVFYVVGSHSCGRGRATHVAAPPICLLGFE